MNVAQRLVALALPILALLAGTSAGAAEPCAPPGGDRWFMVVKTVSTDPAREAEFNDWYDRIDIPDVLEVPGYQRARRGLGQPLPESPWADLQPVEGRYVALYDIQSPNIDATIVDMMLAAQKMVARGRDTDTLKVVGRFYYRQVGAAQDAPRRPAPDRPRYLVLVSADCCANAAATARFDAWYRDAWLPRMLAADGVLRVTRHALHRVAMFDPVPATPFLAVVEIEADSAEAAVRALEVERAALAESARRQGLVAPDEATVYRQIADVARPPGR